MTDTTETTLWTIVACAQIAVVAVMLYSWLAGHRKLDAPPVPTDGLCHCQQQDEPTVSFFGIEE